jgi:hypothetical protein
LARLSTEIRNIGTVAEVFKIKEEPAEKPEPSFDERLRYDFDVDRYIKDVQGTKKIYIYAVSRSIVDK